ncbi:TonB dependent receptor [Paracoccus aminovorans]|uniref:TonB dependent receptor n=1 Tax=Paracoccus aminovorans TaxID=34004 RepID=A0A1I3ANY8_9RHOB|nr:TonB-dependent receptor [Paracoccus aminovorans]CQR84298.1 truncated TonB-dependent receptor [Paracoccus aminovorans]SFH51730.1 TonB dependent receptor [Paracoccus aminovorans]
MPHALGLGARLRIERRRLRGGDAICQRLRRPVARGRDHARWPLGDADLAITYTWSDSLITRGRDAGRPFHNLPRHELGLALDWRVGEPLTLWTRGRYRSRAEALGRSVETPAHVLFDLGLDYRLSDRATVSLGLFNLGNVSAGENGPLPRRLSLMLNAGF